MRDAFRHEVGPPRRMLSLTTSDFTAYAARRKTEGAANATINRELAAARRAFRLAGPPHRPAARAQRPQRLRRGRRLRAPRRAPPRGGAARRPLRVHHRLAPQRGPRPGVAPSGPGPGGGTARPRDDQERRGAGLPLHGRAAGAPDEAAGSDPRGRTPGGPDHRRRLALLVPDGRIPHRLRCTGAPPLPEQSIELLARRQPEDAFATALAAFVFDVGEPVSATADDQDHVFGDAYDLGALADGTRPGPEVSGARSRASTRRGHRRSPDRPFGGGRLSCRSRFHHRSGSR